MKPIRLVLPLLAGMVLLPSLAFADFTATVKLTGDGESDSPGIGDGSITFSTKTDELVFHLTFSGLTSPTAIPSGVPGPAHIHFGASGASGPILFPFIEPYATDFPLGVTSGAYSTTLTASSLIPDPGNGINTFTDAVAAIEADNTYVNIHTDAFPGGEIRGQLIAVPEPSSAMMTATGMLIFGLYGLWSARRRSVDGAVRRSGALIA